MKVNTVRKEIKYDNITETNRLIKSCVNIVGKCSSQTKPKKKCGERTVVEKKNTAINARNVEKLKTKRNTEY